jgi:anthranilate phosphoribosyltransferase
MSPTFDQAAALTERPMSVEETTQVLEILLSATLGEDQGGQLLSSWAARGETATELAATVRFLRQRAVTVPLKTPCFDLCGTGGSGLARFNVSTTVAFIAAAAGIPVAKHGNRGSKSNNGSFDLLEALQIPFELGPEQEVKLQAQTGLCFLFARTHHPAVGKVVPYRKAAGRRTIFNLAGPLANPASIRKQIIGTIDEKTAHVLAEALVELQTEAALVVWGEPGIDEISVTGKTGLLHVTAGKITHLEFAEPTHPGLDYSVLPQGSAEQNKDTFLALLSGKHTGPLLDMVAINAGAAIDLWEGRAPAYRGRGAAHAAELIRSGAALRTFEEHRHAAQALARAPV